MAIWDKLKNHAEAQFLDVIEWLDETRDTLVYRYPVFNNAIQDGGKLVVREGQAAVFICEGQLSEVFGPGTYELSTQTEAIFSFFESIKYKLNYPYKGDIYFVNTRRFPEQKWGTSSPIPFHDEQYGPMEMRAYGVYSYRIVEPGMFLTEMVGTKGLFTTDELNGQFKRKLVSAFVDTVTESEIPFFKIATQYMDIGEAMRERMSPWFEENWGVGLTDFVVESVTLPPEVQEALRKRQSMALLGDMDQYQKFEVANAMGDAMKGGGGGGGNTMMEAGVGLAMGQMMANQMNPGAQAPAAAPAAPAAAVPPPPPAAATFHYNGTGGSGQFNAQHIAQLVAANRGGAHNVWQAGWADWKPWSDVTQIASLVPPPPPPGAQPPPPPKV
jgi:membrane protease subunit (stomatin/prohibitin family)